MTSVYRGTSLEYGFDRSRLAPALTERFCQLGLDDAAREYLDRVVERPHGRLVTFVHRLLCNTMSDFDVNGVLGTYPMHLVSTAQLEMLLDRPAGGGAVARGSLLDVGAGSGDVTAHMAPLFERVVTTEVSRRMSKRLRERGFECHAQDLTTHAPPRVPFDAIALLNVLDRCARPLTLLSRARSWLGRDGRLLVALALPLRPFFYDGPRTLDPVEAIELTGETWEDCVNALVERVLLPAGLEVEQLTRVPYLSGGDSERNIYVLDDVIFVARAGSGR